MTSFVALQGALRGNWFGTRRNDSDPASWPGSWADEDRYYADFSALYMDTIGVVVAEEVPSVPYISSTPTNGDYSMQSGGIAE